MAPRLPTMAGITATMILALAAEQVRGREGNARLLHTAHLPICRPSTVTQALSTLTVSTQRTTSTTT